jgi:hypothetical protein
VVRARRGPRAVRAIKVLQARRVLPEQLARPGLKGLPALPVAPLGQQARRVLRE